MSAPTAIITKAISVKDVNAVDNTITTGPKELTGSTYSTAKVLSSGAFAYNAAKNKTWVISRVTTTLAGVSETFLQFMAAVVPDTTFPYYLARKYIDNTSKVRKNLFSKTGDDTSGNKIKKRTTWVTDPVSTNGSDFGTSGQVPTRAVPGELFVLTNFVDYSVSTSSNYYDYPAITGK